ncbi:MAG: imidazolonepropionase [Demequina sp.]|nr:imidazolonepropionase [Demequina sp.]
MNSTLLTGIGELTTHEDERPVRTSAAIVIDEGLVAWVGDAAAAPAADSAVDLDGAAALPGFVDSHTHLVFAGDRAGEFVARMEGAPYEAGGIRTTVARTRAASDDELLANLRKLVAEALRQGTTTIEVKSGYGLDLATEERSVRLAAQVTDEVTFLGAHVVPADADRDEYLSLVTGPMLDACAPHARWIDVFCEEGAFTRDESERVLRAGIAKGLGVRLHAAQLGPSDAIALAVELDAAAVDHASFLSDADIEMLARSRTVATLLPGVEFSSRLPWTDARRLLDAGVTVALASDCNPGSSFTTSMPMVIAWAVREMRMTPAEAIWAATAGGAQALRRDDVGHLSPGARANIAVLEAPSATHLAYRPGVPLVTRVWQDGVERTTARKAPSA